MNRLYFDNACTSFPKCPGMAEKMAQYINENGSNINRGNYEMAYKTENVVFDLRENLSSFFNAESPRNCILTSGATMSANMILFGMLKKGDHVIISSMEHNCIMRPVEALKKSGVTVDAYNTEDDIEGLINAKTKAVISIHGSNVDGRIFDAEKIGRICKEHGLLFVLDTAQTAGHIEIDMRKWSVDALIFAGHKGLMGPQGIGGFILSEQMAKMLNPIIMGGTGSFSDLYDMPNVLPDRFEAGTLNIPGIVGLEHSLRYITELRIENIRKKEEALVNLFISQIEALSDEGLLEIIGSDIPIDKRTPIVSINMKKEDNARIAFELADKYNVDTRVGLHCAPMAHRSLNTFPNGTIRFSFGFFNTEKEILLGARFLSAVCGRL